MLLNKIDLVPDEKDLALIEARIRTINPEVKIIRTEQSKVDWRAVIGVGASSYTKSSGTTVEASDGQSRGCGAAGGGWRRAVQVFNRMRHMRVRPNTSTYQALMAAVARARCAST